MAPGEYMVRGLWRMGGSVSFGSGMEFWLLVGWGVSGFRLGGLVGVDYCFGL